MKRVEFSRQAREDIAGIADHIAESKPERAFSFIKELLAAEIPAGVSRFPAAAGATCETTCSPSPTADT